MSFLAKTLAKIAGGISPDRIRAARDFLPRATRIRLISLHGVQFRMADTGERLELANLSTTGVAFRRKPDRTWPGGLRELRGELEFSDGSVPVRLKVVHQNEVLGCRFEGETASLIWKIQEYFRLELSAIGMLSVPPDLLQTQPDGKPQWFHGKNNCELYFVTDTENQILRFHLSFFANYIEGAPATPLRFGLLVDDERVKPGIKRSSTVSWQDRFPPDLMDPILKFVTHVPGLAPAHAEQLTVLCQEGQR